MHSTAQGSRAQDREKGSFMGMQMHGTEQGTVRGGFTCRYRPPSHSDPAGANPRSGDAQHSTTQHGHSLSEQSVAVKKTGCCKRRLTRDLAVALTITEYVGGKHTVQYSSSKWRRTRGTGGA